MKEQQARRASEAQDLVPKNNFFDIRVFDEINIYRVLRTLKAYVEHKDRKRLETPAFVFNSRDGKRQ